MYIAVSPWGGGGGGGAKVSCMMRKEWRCTWLYLTVWGFQITRRNPAKILKW